MRASSVHQHCIISASSAHHWHINNAPSVHHPCIISTSSVHHACIISASSVHYQCINGASSAHHQRIISASSVHHQCIISASCNMKCPLSSVQRTTQSFAQFTLSSSFFYSPYLLVSLNTKQNDGHYKDLLMPIKIFVLSFALRVNV